ncbi:hypothetical protein [Ferrovibrio sp.]|uniref:hypothetical protein n=1 Tax=Ferrovibrio sp. TaxID=1917215 RepID=UPI00311FAB8F
MKAERFALTGLLVFAAAIRLFALVTWGPLYQPDSYSFQGYAEVLASSSDWLSEEKLDQQPRTKSTFRVIGYPLVMAALMEFFGERFDIALVVLQSALSVFATYLAFRVARALDLGLWTAVFAAFAYTTSILLLFDMNILVDSFFANGLFISVALLVLGIRGGARPGSLALLGIGLLLALTLLIRETVVYFAPFIALGGALWARQAGRSWWRMAISFVLVLLPVLVVASGYREWNRYRTGQAFLTTGAQMTMWFGPMDVARKKGVDVFAYDPRVQEALTVALKADPGIPMDGAKALNRHLFDNEQMQAPEIAQMAFGAYFHAVKAAPITLLAGRLKRVRPRFLMFNMSQSVETIIEMGEDIRIPGFRDNVFALARGEGSVGIAIRVLLDIAQRTISVTLLLAFIVGVPWTIIRRLRHRSALELPLILAGWFWLIYFAVNGAYILASFEDRYVMATMPLACIGGLWVIGRRYQVLRAETKSSYSRI